MQTIPGIHLATGRFHPALPADTRASSPGRHAVGARLGGWLSAGVNSRHVPAHTHASHEAGVTVLFEGYLSAVAGQVNAPAAPVAALLALYLEAGLDCLPSLRGSYTGLILDSRTNQAHLFNDRRASRPLFYREDADRALLAGPEVFHLASAEPALREIDPVAVCKFLIFASYYNDRTLFPDIKKLPPGSLMSLGPDSVVLRRYWEIRITVPGSLDALVDSLASSAPLPCPAFTGGTAFPERGKSQPTVIVTTTACTPSRSCCV